MAANIEPVIIVQSMIESDTQSFLPTPWLWAASDVGIVAQPLAGSAAQAHFPRVLGLYAREKHWLTLPEGYPAK